MKPIDKAVIESWWLVTSPGYYEHGPPLVA